MDEHPGHFWICLWLVLIMFTLQGLGNSVDNLTKACKEAHHAQSH